MADLPEDLERKTDQFTRLQKNYCQFRSKGFTMAVAAQKAGSSAKDRASLSRLGYGIEQIEGAKEYIEFLKGQRSTMASIDENDLMTLLKDVYERSMKDKNYREANKSAELMAKCLGLLSKEVINLQKRGETDEVAEGTVENITPFKEDEGEETTKERTVERMERLQHMMKELNR